MTMRDINRAVALSGWVFIMLVCATLICTFAFLMIRDGTVDKEISSIASLALGFLFGNAATLIKEIMLKPEDTP